MVFSELSETVQNIYMLNFITLFKIILIFIFIFLAIYIIKNFKPKKSKYLMVSKIRLTYYLMAWVYLLTVPFHFAYLSPKVSLSAVLNPIITFYTVNFIILGIIIALNIAINGTAFVMDLFDDGKRVEGVKADIHKYIKAEPTIKR